ncbi:hypothetical protein [Pseudomonas sp.]|uniref:hypothetical protein n=1 Tax=Pseudomonas sp. TaxID=306 RepID=UPI0028983697|nr:hypothetical protein [Pseudomonas sp.]
MTMIAVRAQDRIDPGPVSRKDRVRPTYLTDEVMERAAKKAEQRILSRIEKKRG